MYFSGCFSLLSPLTHSRSRFVDRQMGESDSGADVSGEIVRGEKKREREIKEGARLDVN